MSEQIHDVNLEYVRTRVAIRKEKGLRNLPMDEAEYLLATIAARDKQLPALENALIKAGADEQALQRRVAELEKALRRSLKAMKEHQEYFYRASADPGWCICGGGLTDCKHQASIREVAALLPPVETEDA